MSRPEPGPVEHSVGKPGDGTGTAEENSASAVARRSSSSVRVGVGVGDVVWLAARDNAGGQAAIVTCVPPVADRGCDLGSSLQPPEAVSRSRCIPIVLRSNPPTFTSDPDEARHESRAAQ